MPKVLVATLVAFLLLLAGPAAASADPPSNRPVLGSVLATPAFPDGAGQQRIAVPAVLGVVAVRVILKKVATKSARLKSGIKRVARPKVRPRLTARVLGDLVREARAWSRRGDEFAKITWGTLKPATQGCIIGIAVTKGKELVTGKGLIPKIEYYNDINAALIRYWEPFSTTDPNLVPESVKLAREFGTQALETAGACAAGAALNTKFKLPPGLDGG